MSFWKQKERASDAVMVGLQRVAQLRNNAEIVTYGIDTEMRGREEVGVFRACDIWEEILRLPEDSPSMKKVHKLMVELLGIHIQEVQREAIMVQDAQRFMEQHGIIEY